MSTDEKMLDEEQKKAEEEFVDEGEANILEMNSEGGEEGEQEKRVVNPVVELFEMVRKKLNGAIEYAKKSKAEDEDRKKNIVRMDVGGEQKVIDAVDYNAVLLNGHKQRGFCQLLYNFLVDENVSVPILLIGYGHIHGQSLQFRAVYGQGNFPDGSLLTIPLNACSIVWYGSIIEYFGACIEIEKARIQARLQAEVEQKPATIQDILDNFINLSVKVKYVDADEESIADLRTKLITAYDTTDVDEYTEQENGKERFNWNKFIDAVLVPVYKEWENVFKPKYEARIKEEKGLEEINPEEAEEFAKSIEENLDKGEDENTKTN